MKTRKSITIEEKAALKAALNEKKTDLPAAAKALNINLPWLKNLAIKEAWPAVSVKQGSVKKVLNSAAARQIRVIMGEKDPLTGSILTKNGSKIKKMQQKAVEIAQKLAKNGLSERQERFKDRVEVIVNKGLTAAEQWTGDKIVSKAQNLKHLTDIGRKNLGLENENVNTQNALIFNVLQAGPEACAADEEFIDAEIIDAEN